MQGIPSPQPKMCYVLRAPRTSKNKYKGGKNTWEWQPTTPDHGRCLWSLSSMHVRSSQLQDRWSVTLPAKEFHCNFQNYANDISPARHVLSGPPQKIKDNADDYSKSSCKMRMQTPPTVTRFNVYTFLPTSIRWVVIQDRDCPPAWARRERRN